MTKYIVVYGNYGCGKSRYAKSLVEIPNSFLLGTGSKLKNLISLQWGGLERHIRDREAIGLKGKKTRFRTIIKDIEEVEAQNLLIDEWSGLFYMSFWKPEEEAKRKIEDIYRAIDKNKYIQKAVFITGGRIPYFPFKTYKKMALWNKEAFARADEVIRMEFGIPIQIKP